MLFRSRNCTIYLNEYYIGKYESGYTSFYYDITDFVNIGGENLLAVRVDATDTMIDVANNCDATQKTNYIDGFSDGLVGAKVGDEVSSDVTFPENYQSSDLAGKKTTFKFKIKGIYKPVTMDTLTDDMVADAFTEQKITTKKDLVAYVRQVLEKQAANSKSQASISAVEDDLLNKCKVTIPDEYLDARLQEYQHEFEADNCRSEEHTLNSSHNRESRMPSSA